MATVQEKIKLMKEKLEHVRLGGGEKSIEKQHKKGKMTARERLNILFDDFCRIGRASSSSLHELRSGKERASRRRRCLRIRYC